MPVVFSYGSLQRPEVQEKTFGRVLEGRADELPAYELRNNGPHANVIHNGRSDSRVRGMAFEITDHELAATDRYEQADAYARVAVMLASGAHAWVYVAVMTVTSRSERETQQIGQRLASTLGPGSIVLLVGDLGAGKTALVRGLAEGLGVAPEDVSSPTFTLMQEYRGGRVPFIHVDLYRLDNAREVDELGLEELGESSVLAIEWAEKLPRPVMNAIEVRIEHCDGDERRLTITP